MTTPDSTPPAPPAPTPAPSVGGTRKFSGIRRTRPSYSCESCRSRRVKCDQIRPKCSNCARKQADCIYGETNHKRKVNPEESTKSEPPKKPVGRTVEGDEKQFNQGYLLIQNGGRSRYIENTFWACVDIEGLELDSLLFDLPLFPLEDTCYSESQDADIDPSKSPRQHYIGSTEPNYPFWISRRPTSLRADSRNLASTLSELPPREVCDYFYKDFADNVHPLIPLIHLPTFNRHYRRFWDWYRAWTPGHAPEGVLAENPSFLPLLFTVLFTGSIARSNLDSVANLHPLLETQKKLYYLIPIALEMVGFPHSPSLYSLMAFLLLNSMLIREEESLGSCSFVAVAFRVCQAMGIHKDGTEFGLDDVQIEERRRVWCHLMHLDAMTSIVSGLPLVASSAMFSNTRMIQELKDEYIGQEQSEDMSTDSIVDLSYIIAAGRYDATSCIRGILLRQFSTRPVTLICVKDIEESIEDLQSRTEKRIERLTLQSLHENNSPSSILNSLSSRPSGSLSKDTSPRVHWAQDLLNLMVEKAYCLLYQPTMRDSNLWKELRRKAIPRFQSFLSIFIGMSTTESYLPYQWLYPGAYQPLQPVAVLLIDLLHNPQSEEASKSRFLLENTFSMLGAEGRITNGALGVTCWPDRRCATSGSRQAWIRLERLRSKVWQKLGLDHNVPWVRSINTNGTHSRSPGTPNQMLPHNQAITRFPIQIDQMNGVDDSLPMDTEAQHIAYTMSTDDNFVDHHANFFPLLGDPLSAEQDLSLTLDPSWQSLSLPGDLTSAMPPFSNPNYLE